MANCLFFIKQARYRTAYFSLMVADNVLHFVSGRFIHLRPDVNAGRADQLSAEQGRFNLKHHLYVQILARRVLERASGGWGRDETRVRGLEEI